MRTIGGSMIFGLSFLIDSLHIFTMTTPASDIHAGLNASLEAKAELDIENNVQGVFQDVDLENFGPTPDGGFQAWINVAGGFCIFFSCLGFTSCFGVLQEYYSTHQLQDRTLDEIAWIGSLSSFIQFAGGAIGGPLFDRYGTWVCMSLLTHSAVERSLTRLH